MPLSQNASAQEIAEQPCDTQYWRQMHAKAWLEAEREIMQNQNLIFKADSVMEYTCFDQFVRINAWDGGNIFVHTNYFGEQIIPRENPTASMEMVMQRAITASFEAYWEQNYGHEFLGGRAPDIPIDPDNHEVTPATDPLTGSGYLCEHMSRIWQASKCLNFIDNDEWQWTDGFYPFENIIALDGGEDVAGYNDDQIFETRRQPSWCGGPFAAGGASWDNQIPLAENLDDGLYPSHVPLGEIYFNVFERTIPGVCFNPPILTGITVVPVGGDGSSDDNGDGQENDNNTYLDGVCTNPGCAYIRPGNGGGEIGECRVPAGSAAVYGTGGSGANNPFGVGTFNPATGAGGF
ncbi:MAG: hypothetical protein AAGB32_05520 [Pseudomonadota bacterium]